MSSPVSAVTDLALARRLEGAEGAANAAFVESRAAAQPDIGATWREIDGTAVMFDGVGSPLTQTFGLGLRAAPTADDLAAMETFFSTRGADVFHEVAPLADPSLLTVLPARGYVPVEFTTVLWRTLTRDTLPQRTRPTDVTTRIVGHAELADWADASAQGWGETPELAAFMRHFGTITGRSRGVTCFAAELDGRMVGTGAIATHHGIALLAGASTVPAFRGRGAQSALLEARLAYATEHGCDVAMMGAAPGSTSQTNAERQGFRVAYTRLKWHLANR